MVDHSREEENNVVGEHLLGRLPHSQSHDYMLDSTTSELVPTGGTATHSQSTLILVLLPFHTFTTTYDMATTRRPAGKTEMPSATSSLTDVKLFLLFITVNPHFVTSLMGVIADASEVARGPCQKARSG